MLRDRAAYAWVEELEARRVSAENVFFETWEETPETTEVDEDGVYVYTCDGLTLRYVYGSYTEPTHWDVFTPTGWVKVYTLADLGHVLADEQ